MYRFLLTPRWWAINVFVALAIPFCLYMGSWQLGRFEDRVEGHRDNQQQVEAARIAEAVPLSQLLPPTTETVGEAAHVTGTFDAEHELLVPGRTLDGEPGYYVLTPLQPADGSRAVPVVRGWLPGAPDPAAVPPAPEGETGVEGILQAAESPRAVNAPTGLPSGQVGVIGAASLINLLPYEVENAWLTVREADEPLTAVPPVAPSGTGLDIKAFQNLGYTAEWFVFAAFTAFMWFRLFRREVETIRDAELGIHPDGPPPATGEFRTDAGPDAPPGDGDGDADAAGPTDTGAPDTAAPGAAGQQSAVPTGRPAPE
ncbi:SURF1 family protein, partial [Streptomyces bohaiensis]